MTMTLEEANRLAKAQAGKPAPVRFTPEETAYNEMQDRGPRNLSQLDTEIKRFGDETGALAEERKRITTPRTGMTLAEANLLAKQYASAPPGPDPSADPATGGDPHASGESARLGLPKDLGQSAIGGVAATIQGVRRSYWQSTLEDVRVIREAKRAKGDLEGVKENERYEQEILADLNEAKDLQDTYANYNAALGKDDQSIGAKAIRSAVYSSPGMAGAFLTYLGTRNPQAAGAVGATAGGAQTYADAYKKASDMGLPDDKAVGYAQVQAAIEALGEKLGLSLLTKQGQSLARRVTMGLMGEGAQEAATTTLQTAVDAAGLGDPKVTVKSFLEDVAVSFLAGAGTGAVAGPAFHAAEVLGGANADVQAFNKMVADMEGSDNANLKPVDQIVREGMAPTQGPTGFDAGNGLTPGAMPTGPYGGAMTPLTTPAGVEAPVGPYTAPADPTATPMGPLPTGQVPLGEQPYAPAPKYQWTSDGVQAVATATQHDPVAAADWILNNSQQFQNFSVRDLFNSPAFVQIPQEKKDAVLAEIERRIEQQTGPLYKELQATEDKIAALDEFLKSVPNASEIPLSEVEETERKWLENAFARGGSSPNGVYTALYNSRDALGAAFDKIPNVPRHKMMNLTDQEVAAFIEKAKFRRATLQQRTTTGGAFADALSTPLHPLQGDQPWSQPAPWPRSSTPLWDHMGLGRGVDNRFAYSGDENEAPLTRHTEEGKLRGDKTYVSVDPKAERIVVERARLVARLIDAWKKQFGLKGYPIHVRMDAGSSDGGKASQGYEGSVLYVESNPRATAGMFSRQLNALAHEFGHAIMPELIRRSPPEVVQGLIEGWKTAMRHAMSMQVTAAQNAFGGTSSHYLSPATWLTLDQAVQADIEQLGRNQALEYSNHKTFYWLTFEEYLAHQFENFLTKNYQEMQAPVRGLFRQMYAALKRIFTTGQKVLEGTPYQLKGTAEEFIQYHVEKAKSDGIAARVQVIENLGNRLLGVQLNPPAIELGVVEELGADVLRPTFDAPMPELRLGVGSFLPPSTRTGIDRFGKIKEWFGTLIGLARDNPHIRELSDPAGTAVGGRVVFGYLQYTEAFANERMKWVSRADERLRSFRRLSQDDQGKIGNVLLDQTSRGTYYTAAELQAVGLSQEAGKVLIDMQEDFKDFVRAMEDSAVDRLKKVQANNPLLPQLVAEKHKQFAELLKRPYFPFSRFGDYMVIIKDQNGKTVEMESYHTQIEARIAFAKAKRTAAQRGLEAKLDKVRENQKAFAGMSSQMIEAIRDTLNLTPDQEKDLNELILKWAPETSFSKHLISRKGTPGYSHDIQRAYATYFFSGAGHLARAKYRDELADAVSRLHNSARDQSGNSIKRREIANYAQRHLEELLNPTADWASLRGMVAVALLGGVLRSAFVNFTQLPAFSYSHLAPKYGDAKAVKELLRGLADVKKSFIASRQLKQWEQDALTKFSSGLPLTPKEERFVTQWTGLTPDEHLGLERAMREGVTDQSLAMEIAALSHGNLISRIQGARRAGFYARQLSWALMLPFELVEKMNRRATFLAAFRLEMQVSNDTDVAYQAGKTAVQQSQFEHSKWNRPQITRGRKGAFLVFMQYQFNALAFLMGGDKGWWRAWAMLLLMGGLTGLPFAGNLMDLLSWLLSTKNKKVDVERELKKASEELFGDTMGNVLTFGTSRYGFGLMPMVDMSGSVSMARPLPLTEQLGRTQDPNRAMVAGMTDLGGATTGLAMRMWRGMMDTSLPAYRRAELVMPFSVGQQAMQALRWYSEGAEVTPGGTKVMTFDVNDWWQASEIAARAVGGFSPRSVGAGAPDRGIGREEYYARKEQARFYETRKALLISQMAEQVKTKNREGQKEVLAEIKAYNKEVPIRALQLSGEKVRAGVMSRLKGDVKDESGGTTRMERAIGRAMEGGEL